MTARDYAQTVQLLEQHGIEAELIGHHGGRSRIGKLATMVTRLSKLRRWARGRNFDAALAHGSHHLTLTARALGIPSSTTFDYEFATVQHQLGCRAATFVVVPDAIPPERLERYGVRPPKLRQYPGLKEEYYLSDFEPRPSVARRARRRSRPHPRRRADTARRLALPPQVEPALPAGARPFSDARTACRRSCCPAPRSSATTFAALALPSVTVPDGAVDAQSLIAFADLVVSAGGTMNREAAALGIPVYTTYGGRLGGVDEALIREGRLRPLDRSTRARAREAERRGAARAARPGRDASAADACLDCRAGSSTKGRYV